METSYYWIRSPYRPSTINDDFKRSKRHSCFSSLLKSRLSLRTFIKVCLTQSADLSVFVLFLRSARRSLQTFLFLFCFFFLRSADKVGRPFCFCSVKVCLTQSADLSVFVLFFLFFYYSFLFFSTATCMLRFLRQFSTNLDEIWHVDSPWWDEQTEYFFKSIGPGVGTGRGPKVLLCFIIGKTLYTVRRDKNFTERRKF